MFIYSIQSLLGKPVTASMIGKYYGIYIYIYIYYDLSCVQCTLCIFCVGQKYLSHSDGGDQ